MKIAIWGSGPLSIEASIHFMNMGADVLLFAKKDLGGALVSLCKLSGEQRMYDSFLHLSLPSSRKFLNIDLDYIPTYREYRDQYLLPLIHILRDRDIVKEDRVLEIYKKTLSSFLPSSRSRMRDLFRIVSLKTGRTDFKGSYRSLPKELIDCLKEGRESFDDVDIVIDARGVLCRPQKIGISGSYTLNERRYREKIHYGIKNIDRTLCRLREAKIVTLIGSGATTVLWLNYLHDKDFEKIFVVTEEETPFLKYLTCHPDDEQGERLKILLKKNFEEFEFAQNIYKDKLFKSRELQVKCVPPVEPESFIEIFSSCRIISIDQFDGQKKFFLTMESIDSILHKTFVSDEIVVTTGYSLPSYRAFKGMQIDRSYCHKKILSKDGVHEEPGFYTIGPVSGADRYHLKEGLSQIDSIEKDMMQFFTKKDL